MSFANIILPKPFHQSFSYKIPNDLAVCIGDFVRVPFGSAELIGVVESLKPNTDIAPEKIKSILEVVADQAMSEQDIKFLRWMSSYTMIPLGLVFKMVVPVPQAFEPLMPKTGYKLVHTYDYQKLTPKQQSLFAVRIDPNKVYALKELQELTSASAAVIKAATDKGAFEKVVMSLSHPTPNPHHHETVYEPDQMGVVQGLHNAVESGDYEAILVHGVTGSGKTEVYFEAIAAALYQNQQSLVLLPEISLTPQWLQRFEARFGCRPHLWHSQMTMAQRRDTYKSILSGDAKVIVGARSALFLPYQSLGVIIVDEEHEGSYKQEEGGIYHARDMAVARAFHKKIPVVLVSATPSLESIVNVQDGKYKLLSLPNRHGGARLPDVHTIDMRAHKKTEEGETRFLSEELRQNIQETYAAGDQTLLFLNRRGYAPLTLCRACGERLECPNCTAWVVLHKRKGFSVLQCHHCGFRSQEPKSCKKCHANDEFVSCGPGVERIADEVKSILPEAKQMIMASDFFESTEDLVTGIRKVQSGEVDIIIGTQMMAKGHHFPKLTMVGVVDADLGLTGGDLRACEKTYQLLQQVSGRCGRAEKAGTVYLQTYYPEHPVLQALVSGEDEQYREQELLMRQSAGMPPFSKLVSIIVSGVDQNATEQWLQKFSRMRPRDENLDIMGPAPAPLAKLRKQYRYRFLLKCSKGFPVQSYVQTWLDACPAPRMVKVAVDVDPVSFL